MFRAHAQGACEGAAQRLVGRNQRLETLVDLAVFALPALLHGLHEQKAYAHHQAGHQKQPEDRGQQRRPGTEIKRRTHAGLSERNG